MDSDLLEHGLQKVKAAAIVPESDIEEDGSASHLRWLSAELLECATHRLSSTAHRLRMAQSTLSMGTKQRKSPPQNWLSFLLLLQIVRHVPRGAGATGRTAHLYGPRDGLWICVVPGHQLEMQGQLASNAAARHHVRVHAELPQLGVVLHSSPGAESRALLGPAA